MSQESPELQTWYVVAKMLTRREDFYVRVLFSKPYRFGALSRSAGRKRWKTMRCVAAVEVSGPQGFGFQVFRFCWIFRPIRLLGLGFLT